MLKLYENIKRFREDRGWSQTDLAKRVGFSEKSSISRIESGKLDIPASLILKFCDVFGVDLDALWGDKEPTRLEPLTASEYDVITAYRNAPRLTQDAVHGVLGIEKKEQSFYDSRKEA